MGLAGSGDMRRSRHFAGLGELQRRSASALVLAACALGSTWIGGALFVAVWAALAAITLAEWVAIVRRGPNVLRWLGGGTLYAGMLLGAVLVLRSDARFGMLAILFLFAIVWAADIVAFFAGRLIGGPKLAPSISPKKTWSGMIGGAAGGIAAGLGLLAGFSVTLRPEHAIVAAALALASVAGDLFESWFKRKFGVKDSSDLIPGHGGFMDRLDGFIFAAALAVTIGIARGGVSGAATGLIEWPGAL